MKRYVFFFIFGLLLFISVISTGCINKSPKVEYPTLSDFTYSSCSPDSSVNRDTVIISMDKENLELTIDNLAVFNCCLDSISVDFSYNDDTLKLKEYDNVTNPCYCICDFQVISHILLPYTGNYYLKIWTDDNLLWEGEIHI